MGSTQQAFNNADELCWTAATSGSCASPPTGATIYTYDSRGNRTRVAPPSGGATTLTYDQANRLTGYGASATYAYNGDGLRMSKTVGGSTSQFLWDVGSTLPLLLKEGSTAYVCGPGGLPLEQINGSTALWLHHDQLGSTRLVTNSSGTTQATYNFDAYGKLTASTGTITNPLRYAGEYWDAESGFYYLRARNYDPATGQFITLDPVTASTREPYGYGIDSPLNVLDPAGLGPNQEDIGPLGKLGWLKILRKSLGGQLPPEEEAEYQRLLEEEALLTEPETCEAIRVETAGLKPMNPRPAIKIISQQMQLNEGALRRNFDRIKSDYGLPPTANTKIDPSSGDISIADTGEVFGNIFDGLSGRNLR